MFLLYFIFLNIFFTTCTLHLLLTLQGLLDLLANRCLAQGTNAWTATDHTAYTMETAGSEGFLNLLPIYLDHVLYPTLKVSNVQCNENVFSLYPLDQFMFLGNCLYTYMYTFP